MTCSSCLEIQTTSVTVALNRIEDLRNILNEPKNSPLTSILSYHWAALEVTVKTYGMLALGQLPVWALLPEQTLAAAFFPLADHLKPVSTQLDVLMDLEDVWSHYGCFGRHNSSIPSSGEAVFTQPTFVTLHGA